MTDNVTRILDPHRQLEHPRVLNRYTITPFDEEPIYIGRPSKWQNPFPVTKELPRGESVKKFETWVLTQPQLLEDAKRELKGRNLLCFCTPRRCHGDFWLKLVNAANAGPEPLDNYRVGQPISTWGYCISDKSKPLTLNDIPDQKLHYSDTNLWENVDLESIQQDLYRIDFTVQCPQVYLQQNKDWDLENCQTKFDAVVFVPQYRLREVYYRKAVLLNPRQQITFITKLTP